MLQGLHREVSVDFIILKRGAVSTEVLLLENVVHDYLLVTQVTGISSRPSDTWRAGWVEVELARVRGNICR